MALHMERLRCCATRPLREGVELMLSREEKLERIGDAARILEAQNEILYAKERTATRNSKR